MEQCAKKKRDGELGCRVENALAMAIGNVHNIEKGRKSGKCRRDIWSVLKWFFNAASGAATPPWSPTTSTSVALHLLWREHNSTACHSSWLLCEASPKSRSHFSSTRQLREPLTFTMYTMEYPMMILRTHPRPPSRLMRTKQKGIGHLVNYLDH